MAEEKITVENIDHISVRELAYKIKAVDKYIGNTKGLEAASKRKPSLAFFLGAGASFESGIMLAGQMMKQFKEDIFEIHCNELKTDEERIKWLTEQNWYKDGKEEYGCLFEKAHATKADRQRFIENMIADKEPSFGYVVLADLLLRNYINTVLTTNFDDLVYISATNFTGIRPIVYAYGILASEMKMTSPHSKVLKLHGDYLYSNIVNTSKEMLIQSQALKEPLKNSNEAISSLNMERQVRTVFDNFGLVVIGYSGGDKTVMELLENVSKDNGLYWCYVKGFAPDEDVLELVQKKGGKLVEITGFDSTMKIISDITNFSIDDLLESFEQRKEKLKGFLIDFDEEYTQKSLNEYAEELKEITKDNSEIALTSKDLLILASEAKDKNDLQSAEMYLRKAIEVNPKDATAFNNLGYLLAKDKEHWKEAEKYLLISIELNPKRKSPHINLGNLFLKDRRKWKKAETYLLKAIELDPRFFTAYVSLGNLYYRQNKVGQAINSFSLVLELEPKNSSALVRLASLYKKLEKFDQYDAFLEEAKESIDEKNYYGLALINSMMQNKKEMFRFLNLAIKNEPTLKFLAETDPEFDWIRDEQEFTEILNGVK